MQWARHPPSRTTRPSVTFVNGGRAGCSGGCGSRWRGPEVSCHPEQLLPNARTVVAAALCYWAPDPEPGRDAGILPRYAWRDHYGLLRERLEALGRTLGGDYRVLVDENDHVDREAAVRAGVGFYGKNTMVITRGHGSWVVLGTLVTEVEIEASEQMRPGCWLLHGVHRRLPHRRAGRAWSARRDPVPLVLDADRRADARGVMDALEGRVYGCDICQDVCPWNRGVELRRAADALPVDAAPTVDLAAWLDRDERRATPRALSNGSSSRGTSPRWLRRNALVALRQCRNGRRRPGCRAVSRRRR